MNFGTEIISFDASPNYPADVTIRGDKFMIEDPNKGEYVYFENNEKNEFIMNCNRNSSVNTTSHLSMGDPGIFVEQNSLFVIKNLLKRVEELEHRQETIESSLGRIYPYEYKRIGWKLELCLYRHTKLPTDLINCIAKL